MRFVVPVWSTIADVRETELRLAEIRADLFCELVAVSYLLVYWGASYNMIFGRLRLCVQNSRLLNR